MNTDTFKVINERGDESVAQVITTFEYKEKEYVVYSIDKDQDNVNIYVSKLLKDNSNNDIICDIEDEQERDEIFRVVEEILSTVV